MALKASDSTPLRTFQFRISLNPGSGDYGPGQDVESPKDVMAKLETIKSTVPLVELFMGGLAPVGSGGIKVHMEPYRNQRAVGDVRDMTDTPIDGPGWVDVTFAEKT